MDGLIVLANGNLLRGLKGVSHAVTVVSFRPVYLLRSTVLFRRVVAFSLDKGILVLTRKKPIGLMADYVVRNEALGRLLRMEILEADTKNQTNIFKTLDFSPPAFGKGH